jgi:propanol-preferring alcohol dehydrogenase
MKAMVLQRLCNLGECRTLLEPVELPVPVPGEKEILLKVSTCGVCHTELDEIEGRAPPAQLPVIPGHQVVAAGNQAGDFKIGDWVGVAWIFPACGVGAPVARERNQERRQY